MLALLWLSMNKRVCKISLLILGLLVLSCSRAAPREPLPSSSATACTSNSDCTVSNEVCDTIFNNGTDTGKGSCRQTCNPNGATSCPGGDFCNPINNVCETACGSQSTNFCPTRLAATFGTGYTSTCIANNYCAMQPSGSNCPLGFKASGGFCRPASNCPGGLTPDPITGTCELKCATNSECTALNYTPAAANSPQVTFSCSPVTSTCVLSCSNTTQVTDHSAWPASGCLNMGSRGVCYVPGNPKEGGSGTCEQDCSTNSKICTGSFSTCSEQICQQSCSSDTDCSKNANGKTRCDLIDNICRQGCASNTDCPTETYCSRFSATCIQGCSSTGSNTCVDATRSKCFLEENWMICETPVGASSCTKKSLVEDSIDGICAIGCSYKRTSEPCPQYKKNDGFTNAMNCQKGGYCFVL